MTSPEIIIQWLLDNKLAHTFFHKGAQEQMLEITDYGIEINTILEKLKTTSDESKQTNKILEKSNIGSLSSFSSKDVSELENLNKKDEVITPEQRCYTILQVSKYIRIPEENPQEKIESFLDSAKGCSWEYPQDEIQERQFETNFKNYFSQFADEIIKFAKSTESTIDGKKKPFTEGYRGMDDQGFEGVIIQDESFYRNIEDELTYIFYGVSDEQLESRWQAQAEIIKVSLTKAYDNTLSKEESDEMFEKAKQAQSKQESVQAEITRRHK